MIPSPANYNRNKRKPHNSMSRANTRSRCFQVSCSFKRCNARGQVYRCEQKYVPLNKTMDECLHKLPACCQPRHLENVTIEKMAPEERDKVLSKLSSPSRSNKRTEMITSRNPLKSRRVPLNGTKGGNYPLSIVRSREFHDFHNSQEILNAKAISQP